MASREEAGIPEASGFPRTCRQGNCFCGTCPQRPLMPPWSRFWSPPKSATTYSM